MQIYQFHSIPTKIHLNRIKNLRDKHVHKPLLPSKLQISKLRHNKNLVKQNNAPPLHNLPLKNNSPPLPRTPPHRPKIPRHHQHRLLRKPRSNPQITLPPNSLQNQTQKTIILIQTLNHLPSTPPHQTSPQNQPQTLRQELPAHPRQANHELDKK
jgi:hypothetical protein